MANLIIRPRDLGGNESNAVSFGEERPVRTRARRLAQFMRSLGLGWWLVVLLAFLTQTSVSRAHNLDDAADYLGFDSDTLATLQARAVGGQPLLQAGDTVGLILKATPRNGTPTGAGGYSTFFIPVGTQLVGADYGQINASGIYQPIAMKGPSILSLGAGSIGPKATPGLIGLQLGPNVTGQSSLAVSASGMALGTMSGVYGDTGIFYSTDPKTAWQSWKNGGGLDRNSLTTADNALTNNSGDVVLPTTQWDAEQLLAFGVKSPMSPIVDSADGRGNAPWGMASGVAGPQSGYAWAFDKTYWDANAADPNRMKNATRNMGPWKRIQYAGSLAAKDQPGLLGSVLGYSVVDASNLGTVVSAGNPLPATTSWTDNTSPKAVRVSWGGIEIFRPEYSRIKLKILVGPGLPNSPFDAAGFLQGYGDTFGGDAGGEYGNKDHLWRYYAPTTVTLSGAPFVFKRASKEVVAPGEDFFYSIYVMNFGSSPLTNVVITDTLPSGVLFLNASPVQNSGPNPLTWNLGGVLPQSMRTITVNVRATGTGLLTNTICSRSDQGPPTCETETTYVGQQPLLYPDKTVTPSTAMPSDTVDYTISIRNDGTSDSLIPMTITDLLPDGFTYSNFISAMLNGAAAPSAAVTVSSAIPARPIFNVTMGIKPGKTLTITFRAQISSSQPIGVFYNSYSYAYGGKVMSTGSLAPVTVGGGRIGDTVFRDWNGNGIQDAGEDGISGLSAQLFSASAVLLSTKTTDASGKYLFTGVNAGTYTVKIVPPSGYLQTYDLDGLGSPNQATLTLAAGQQRLDADFGYSPGGTGTISGTVFEDASNNGKLESASESSIPNVAVSLYRDANGNGTIEAGTDYLIMTRQSGSDGSYSFSGLSVGISYIAKVDAASSGLSTYFTGTFQASTPTTKSVANLAANTSGIDFGFWQAVPASIGDLVYRDANGNGVFDSGDIPLPLAGVKLYLDANDDGVGAAGELVDTQQTDASGIYHFYNVGSGHYLVVLDTMDADLPGGLTPEISNYQLAISPGEVITTADFPLFSTFGKSVDRATAAPGDTLNYSITPEGFPSSDLLTNLRVTDIVPTGTTFVSAAQGGANSGGTVTWNLGSNTPPLDGFSSTNSLYAFCGGLQTSFYRFDSSLGTWSNLASAPGTVGEGAALATNGTAIFGLRGGNQTGFWKYNFLTSSWVTLTSTPAPVKAGGALVSNGTNLYALRGAGQKNFWKYDTSTNIWTAKASAPENVDDGGAMVYDGAGTIYAFRGKSDKFWKYTIATDQWTVLAKSLKTVDKGGALGFANGYVYGLPGAGGTNFMRYDPSANTWKAMRSSPTAISEGGALSVAANSIYAMAGNSSTFLRYSITSNTWSTLTNLPGGAKWGGALVQRGITTELTTSMDASPPLVRDAGAGKTVTVSLALGSTTTISSVTIPDPTVVSTAGASATKLTGPVMSTVNGSTIATWTYNVRAGTTPGSVTFSRAAFTSGGQNWPATTANSVLATPALTFRVTVNNPAGVTAVRNVAVLQDDGVIPATNSPVAITQLAGSIAGKVFADSNGDGSQGVSELGLSGVRIYATNGAVSFSDLSDGNGNYIINGLSSMGGAAWTVRMDLATLPTNWSATTASSLQRVLPLNSSQITGVDFGAQPPAPSGSITGMVFRDANANLNFDTGTDIPMPSITVKLYNDIGTAPGVVDAGDVLLATKVSDISGTYSFGGLAAGTYLVDVDQADPDVPPQYQLAPLVNDPAAVTLVDKQARSGVSFPFVYTPPILSKAVSAATANAGDQLIYSLQTDYTGTSLLSNLRVTDTVPTGTNYVAASANAGATLSGSQLTWSLGSSVAGIPGTSTGSLLSLNLPVTASSDDAEEEGLDGVNLGPGGIYLTSSDLELTQDLQAPSSGIQKIGVRFTGLTIPRGAVIQNAYLTFRAQAPDAPNDNTSVTTLAIAAQAIDNAPTFTSAIYSITNRTLTNAQTAWGPAPWTPGSDYNSPSLSAVVQEVVNRSGWASGNSMVFVLTGDGGRTAESWDDVGTNPPRLVVQYLSAPTLTTTLAAGPTVATNGDQITVRMTLTSSSPSSTAVTPSAPVIIGTNGASASLISGPLPVSATVDATGTTFTWIYQAVAATNVGQLTFKAQGGNASWTWPQGTSNSVIVHPPLTFRATVSNPITANPILNTAYVQDNSALPLTPSNTVETSLGGSIGDLVWADLDGDGVQDANEPGWPGITVTVTSGVRFANAVTDSSGRYRVYGLDANSGNPWTVSISLPAFPSGSVATTPTSLSRTLPTNNSAISDADFGVQPPPTTYPPAVSIAGNLWLDTTRDGVIDPTEAGIGNATVELYRDLNANGTLETSDLLIRQITTSATGSYLFPMLATGSYLVRTVSATLPSGAILVSGGANLTTGVRSLVIPANAALTGVNFGYDYNGLISGTVFYDTNADGIRDLNGVDNILGNVDDETPVIGSEVMLFVDANANGLLEPEELIVQLLLTDPNGGYTFDRLPPGNYLVKVEEFQIPAPPTSVNAGKTRTMMFTLSETLAIGLLPSQSVPSKDFGFAELTVLEGHVFHDVNSDGLRSPSEPTLPNITVNLTGTTSAGASITMSMATDAEGEYKFLAPPGTYVVAFDQADPDFPAGLTRLTTAASYTLTVTGGLEFETLDFGRDHNGTLGGTVFNDEDGNGTKAVAEAAMGNIVVELYDSTGINFLDAKITASDGSYRFDGLANATYVIKVLASTLPSLFNPIPTVDPTLPLDGSGTSTVTNSSSLLTLNFGYRLLPASASGKIVFGNGNGIADVGEPPVTNVTVTLVSAGLDGLLSTADDTTTTTLTDATGAYVFSAVRPGLSTLSYAVQAGYWALSDVDGGNPNSISLNLTATQSMTGRDFEQGSFTVGNTVWLDANNNGIKNVGETGVPGIAMQLWNTGADNAIGGVGANADTQVGANTTTDALGNYSFTQVPTGKFYVKIPVPPTLNNTISSVVVTLDNGIDNDNNGAQSGAGQPVSSMVITLAANTEPGSTGSTNTENTIDFGFKPGVDFGDYTSFGSASSNTVATLTLGSIVDSETAATLNATATGDDITGSPDDEEGVVMPAQIWRGETLTIPVVVNNTTGSNAYLNVWIDYNQNGVLTDAGEQLVTNQIIPTGTVNGTQSITFTVPGTATIGTAGIRCRLTDTLSPTPTGLSGNGEVEDNVTSILAAPTLDFGDYSLFASASSTALATLKMGALVDSEPSATTNVTATGDDITGTDDEDGITFSANIYKGQTTATATVNVTNTTAANAFLSGWIDFNNNGVLTDAGEQIISNVTISKPLSGVNQVYTFTVPATAVTGTVGARFRLTSTSAPGSTGASGNGEVEDHLVTIVAAPTLDFGDYAGFASASAAVVANLRLGAATDTEVVATTNAAASGDDITGTTDDEDSTTPPSVTVGQTGASITINVTNSVAATAYLSAWVDFNNNGVLTDPGEQIIVNSPIVSPTSNSNKNYTFNVPLTATPGVVGMRLRLSSISGAGPTGLSGNGEVEDHLMTIVAPTSDFGDYSLFGSASSTVLGTLKLGSLTDAEFAATTNSTATGDDTTGVDDEDGITLPAIIAQGQTNAQVTVNVTNATGASAYLNGWIDFNNSGVLTDAGDRIINNVVIPSGLNGVNQTYLFSVPIGAVIGNVGVRFRLTSTNTANTTGASGNGEVEDHIVTIVAPLDYGDFSGVGSASSIVDANLRMGALVDAETAATLNASATGDDATGSDDEDGVTLPAMTAGASVFAQVIVNNATAAPAYLSGWIDYDNNGILTSPGEQVVADLLVPAGSSNLSLAIPYTVPPNVATGVNLGVRFRLTNVIGALPTGSAGTGEVEDNVTNIDAPLFDYGDWDGAPDAFSLVNQNLRIGALVDTEFVPTKNVNATGDDITGVDDEDGVTIPAMVVGGSVTISATVTNSTAAPAYLNGWIDFNNNGSFDDVGEQIAINVPVATNTLDGVKSINLSVPVTAVTGSLLGVRFRLTDVSSPGPTGLVGSGEVEDYAVVVASPSTDFGDFNRFGLASSNVNGSLRMGTLVDAELIATTNATATGDDITGEDDEDGVTLPPLTAGGPAAISVVVTNNSGGSAYLNAWIDYNNNGVVTDVGEQVAADVLIPSGTFDLTQILNIIVPANATTGASLGLRFRLTSVSGVSSTGAFGIGEVEDYVTTILSPTLDFGDWSGASDAWAVASATLRMGALLDTEFSATNNSAATGDDITSQDDEDGVTVPALTGGLRGVISVAVTNNSGAPGYLSLWIDYNNNGSFFDAGEKVANDYLVANGTTNVAISLSTTVPANVVSSVPLGVRARFSNLVAQLPIGSGGIGEVEDTVTTIAPTPIDYGDHIYGSLAASTASQMANTDIRIGANLTDAEAFDPSNSAANLDDNTGTNDEDLTMPAFTVGAATTVVIPVTIPVLANLSGSTARLGVWVDWNGDGLVTGTNETLASVTVSTAGTNNYTFSLTPPIGTTSGTKYLRIRITEGSIAPAFNGASQLKGEVEDYAITVAAVSVGGLVYEDKNYNGQYDSGTDAVINGAVVTLYKDLTGNDITADDVVTPYAQPGLTNPVTLAGSVYSFTNLPAGTYFVKVKPASGTWYQGGIPVTTDPILASKTDNKNYGNLSLLDTTAFFSPVVTLTVGGAPAVGVDGDDANTDSTIDFGLWQRMTIGNLVFNDSNNDGSAAAETGIGSVTLEIFKSTDATVGNGDDVSQGTTTSTAGTGAYGFGGLLPGNYFLKVTPTLTYQLKSSVSGTDNGTDNDNNGTTQASQGQPIYTHMITLSANGEPGVTAGGGNAENTIDIGLRACPAINITPASLATGTQWFPYSQTITVTGGTGTMTLTYSGSLPAGLAWSGGSGTATISGTPTVTGSFPIVVTGTDPTLCAATINYTITVNACGAITINPATVPAGTLGSAYAATTFTGSGGTGSYVWSMVPTPLSGQLGWWPGEGDSLDLVGTNHGTQLNGLTFAAGKSGNAFNLDGVDDSISIADNAVLKPAAITAEAWVYPSAAQSANATVLMKTTAAAMTDGYGLGYLNATQFGFWVNSTAAASRVVTGSALSTGAWHHVVGTYDGATIRLYIDGAQVGTGTVYSTAITHSTSPLVIGRAPGGNTWLGKLDEVALYNRALTAAEVTTRYTFSPLPSGMAFNAATPNISGTPVSPSAAGTYPFTIIAQDTANCTGRKDYSLALSCPIITLTGTPPAAYRGVVYSTTITASGGTGTYTWPTASGLPVGLTAIAGGANNSVLTISGTTNVATGSFPLSITATDGSGCSGSANPSITLKGLGLGSLVYEDKNFNGQYDAGTDAVIVGATVSLYADTGSAGADGADVLVSQAGVTATTTTNASGVYSFAGLAPGSYFIKVKPASGTWYPGGSPISTNPLVASKLDNKNYGNLNAVDNTAFFSPVLALTVGGQVASGIDGDDADTDSTIDFGIWQRMSIGNLVWNDANNDGLTASESGIPSVTVELYKTTNVTVGDADDVWQAITTTSAIGSYSFTGLLPGNYFLKVTPTATYQLKSSYVGTDNGVDNDNNGVTQASQGQPVYTHLVVLTANNEPGPTLGGGNTENTIDIGLRACDLIAVSPTQALLNVAVTATPYTQVFTGSGSTATPYTYSVSSGTIPTWATWTAGTATLSGTPTSTTAATFTIRATDTLGCFGERTYTITPVDCFVVTNTNNSGLGSLRDAINCANARPGLDAITFNIAGVGVKTITLASSLPAITDPVSLDGYTQPTATANTLTTGNDAALKIEINGANIANIFAIRCAAGSTGSTIKGLVINRCYDAVILATSNCMVQGCFIGTTAAGTAASANADDGILLTGATGSTIGGTTAAARNIISGNSLHGIELVSSSTGNTIQGNYIGTNAAGTSALPNAWRGIDLVTSSTNNTISAGNVISGNTKDGLRIQTTGNTIQGNTVGLNAAGTAAVANGYSGIEIQANNNTIGGTTASQSNVVSGNTQAGVAISGGTGNVVKGNYIGVNSAGTALLGNGAQGVTSTSASNTIGGILAGEANIIAGNGTGGVYVGGASAQNVIVRGNSIYANIGLGLDIGLVIGLSPNDGTKSGSESNNGMDYPILSVTSLAGSTLTATGYVGNNAAGSATFAGAIVDLYAGDNSPADQNGQIRTGDGLNIAHPEGRLYLGSLTADGLGKFTGNITVPAGTMTAWQAFLSHVPNSADLIAATATDAAGNTSEFGPRCQGLTISPSSLANGNVGQVYLQATAFSVTGASGSVTWSTPAPLPGGITWDGATKKLIGTPTTIGTTNIVFTATDSANCVGTATIPLTIDPALLDFGDLPDPAAGTSSLNYETLLTNNGPRHSIMPGIRLGALIDAELNGQPTSLADGDGADEDAFVPAANTFYTGNSNTISIPLANTAVAASLYAFIDLNNDGDFLDANEALAVVPVPANATSVNLVIPVPATGVSTNVSLGFRLRLTHDVLAAGGAAALGAATDGEVEDYLIQVKPGLQIGNLVWNDTNANGVWNAGELGLTSVQVDLYTSVDLIAGNGDDVFVKTTTTDSSGIYNFASLLPGKYVVRVTPPAAFPLTSGPVVALDNQVNNDNNGTQVGLQGTLIYSPVLTLTSGGESITDGDTDPDTEYTVDFALKPCGTIAITPSTLAAGNVGTAYLQPLTANGGSGGYVFSQSGGSMAPGLVLNPAGLVLGTPSTAGTYSFTAQAVDTLGCIGTQAISITIRARPIIYCTAKDELGRYYVAGSFYEVNGVARTNLARLNSDGTLDLTFAPAIPNGPVYALSYRSGVLYAGGTFTTWGGSTQNLLVKLDMLGARDSAFSGTVLSGAAGDGVYAISANSFYVAGKFSTPKNSVTALDPSTGAVVSAFNPTGPSAGATVYDVFYDGTRVVTAGDFTTFNGATRRGLTALSTTGATDANWLTAAVTNNTVRSLIQVPTLTDLIAAGDFSTFGSASALQGTARFVPSTGANTVGYSTNIGNLPLTIIKINQAKAP